MNLKPNQNLRKESVKYKSNKKYKYLLFSGLALCSLSLEAKLNNDKVKAESEETQTATKLEKDPLTGFSNTKRNIAFNDNPLLQEDTGNTSFNDSLVTVNKDNFASHFVLNGSAKWSVKDNRGILLLTDNVEDQAGNATLSTKISVNDEFHLTGKINLGNKSAGQKGADGIALAFHTGDSNQIGIGGGCLGLAGLPYGFGFKLDTFWNGENKYRGGGYEKDPDRFNRDDGNQSFGAFAYDEIREGVSTVITYDGDDAPAQKISEPDNNTFRDFQADYNGTTHVLTIKYDNKTWSKCIDSWIPKGTTSLSFVITGVTGGKCNKQEFEINEFKYTGYGVVNTNFVNTDDNNVSIASLPQSNAKIKTGISLTNANDKIKEIEKTGTYYLTGASITKGETTSDFDPTKTELNAEEDPQTITYKFATVKTALQAKEDPVVIYAGDDFNSEVGFESAKDKDGSSLPFNKITVDSSDLNKDAPGEYFVKYSYTPKGYGNVDLKTVSTKAKVKVIDRKYVKLKYVDQSGNVIDPKYLAGIPAAMSSGQHSGAYGSQFTLNPSEELTLNNKSYYTFKEAKLGTSTIDLNTNKNLTFGDNDQEVTLVYQGAAVNSNDTNAITVHHYLRDKDNNDTTTPVKEDSHIGGNIGDTVTINPTDEAHQAPTGYTLVPNQESVQWMLQPDKGKEVIFYYTADEKDNITVSFIDANSNAEITPAYKPTGNHTGDTLDISGNGLANHLPKGYHYATAAELKDKGLKQPNNPIYKPEDQNPKVYVIGNKVAANDENALTVHYYLRDANGNNTTTKVKEDRKVGGQVGVETVIKKDADEQKAPAGYTMDPEQTDQKYTFKPEGAGKVTFYYTADATDNIKVSFIDANSDKEIAPAYQPTGNHTGDTLDISGNGLANHLPTGYHYATEAELKAKGLKQPENPVYTPKDQNPKVYVVGNMVGANDENALTVHYYLRDANGNNTTTKVKEDRKVGGQVGVETVIKKDADEQKAPDGYTMVSNQSDQKYTFKPKDGGEVTFYYTGNEVSNIKVDFVDVSTNQVISSYVPRGKHVGDTLLLTDPASDNNSDLAGRLPEGYHYATKDDLSGKTQPDNPIYTTKDQNPKVYVAIDEAKKPIKIEVVNVKDLKDKIIDNLDKDNYINGHVSVVVNPNGHKYGDEITLSDYVKDNSSNSSDSSDQDKGLIQNGVLTLPKGYRAAKSEELERLGLQQTAKAKFGKEEVNVKYFVIKEGTTYTLTIKHRLISGRKTEDFQYLANVTQKVAGDEELVIDTNQPAHQAPAGYQIVGANYGDSNSSRVDRSLNYNLGTGLIRGTLNISGADNNNNITINIIYKRV